MAPVSYGKYSVKVCGRGGETAKTVIQADGWSGTLNRGKALPTSGRLFTCPKTYFTEKGGTSGTGDVRGKTIAKAASVFGVGVATSTAFTQTTGMRFAGGTKRSRYYLCGARSGPPSSASVLLTGARDEKRT